MERKVRNTKSAVLEIYQKHISRSLGSDCEMFPHDSFSAQLSYQSCGPIRSVFYSMHRWYYEPDAPTLGVPMMWDRKKILYWDISNVCE